MSRLAPDPDRPIPHAALVDAVRAANPRRMANGLRQRQFDDILFDHPDVVARMALEGVRRRNGGAS